MSIQYKNVDGVQVKMTAAEIAAMEADRASWANVPVNDPLAPSASIVAVAELGTAGGEVTGIESACGIGFAMMIMDGVFWLFFSSPQPDTKYLPFVQSPGFNVDVTAREMDYLEITVTDRATNTPAIPASLSVTVQRTQ